jgi:predicted esterase
MPPSERHVRVHRTARFYVLGTPDTRTKELWVACHGYGQSAASFAKALEPLADDGRVVVAPEALSRFYLDDPAKRHGPDSPVGASWMTRDDRESEITDYVEYLDAVTATVLREMEGGRPSVIAMGFSQGVATAARWTALGRTAIRHLILWAGTVPHDLPIDRRDKLFRGAQVTLVAGRRDTFLTPEAAEQAHTSRERQGILSRVVTFDGAHTLNSETLRRLAKEISSDV